jgi:hypothetical protein
MTSVTRLPASCSDYNRVLNHLMRLRGLWNRTPSENVRRRTEAAMSVWGRRARELREIEMNGFAAKIQRSEPLTNDERARRQGLIFGHNGQARGFKVF